MKRVALVFDDGPKPGDAQAVIAALGAEKIPATFAVVGSVVGENPGTAREILSAGHELVNHSHRHRAPADLSDAELDAEVADAQRAVAAATGFSPRWYWPPFLALDDRVRAAAGKAGLNVYVPRHLVGSQDYDMKVTAEEIFRRSVTDVRDGSVILFHEWRRESREQLPAVLAELKKQGCVFFTFSGLADALNEAAPPKPSPAATGDGARR